MPRKPKPIRPETQFIVVDANHRALSPAFYQEELAQAVLKEMSKLFNNLTVESTEGPTSGSFPEAVELISRENDWLNAARSEKLFFSGLCAGWASPAVSSQTPGVTNV